jgi:putative redox protein
VNGSFPSGELTLACHVALPTGWQANRVGMPAPPGLIVCHGFPVGPIDARRSAGTFPELVDRVASEMGWVAMTFTFRGCGGSEGNFSLAGWADDLRAAIDYLIGSQGPAGVWIVGTSTGGSLATCVAADDTRVRGVALLAARRDFDDWAEHPRRFLEHAREVGAVRSPGFPPAFDRWARELRSFRPLDAARRFAPRPMLVMHGDDDEEVPVAEARALAAAHGTAELRVIAGAGHRLRHDPRAVATLLGWLDRQRNRS